MIRTDIITTIGRQYLTSNIENEEFSYGKALKAIGKDYTQYLSDDAKRVYKDLDIRFASKKLSVLVETKQSLTGKDLNDGIIQLQNYINFEHEFSDNQVVAILASTNNDKIYVWYDMAENISLDNYVKEERKIKTFNEYENIFFGTKNDKLKVVQNTYNLNEMLHKYGINEKIRSQFVGTCLLALKNGLKYDGLSATQVVAGIKEKLERLLNNNINKAEKILLLDKNVLNSQDVNELTDDAMQEILNTIEKNILPYINEESTQGQDLLNLFFTTFNKYVGKADKNQAFTPDHITQLMCHAININRNSIVLDPCCGSGAFLVRAMTEAMDDCDNNNEREKIKVEHIFGIENEDIAFGLSTTNMLIHGDGNSNIIKGSMFDNSKWILDAKIDTVLMNPPYNATRKQSMPSYVKQWKKDTKTDPSKGLHYVYYIANLLKRGKLAVLLPMQCAIGTTGDIKYFKEKMLEENTLDAVFSLPEDMFYPGASVVACCMIFNLGVRHDKASNKETFFGYFKDDGFEKKKNLGRVEKEDNGWKKIEEEWLKLYRNRETKIGYSVTKQVSAEDEWLAEAYMETDFSKLETKDFQETINNYLSYLVKKGEIHEN